MPMLALPPLSPERAPHRRPSGALVTFLSADVSEVFWISDADGVAVIAGVDGVDEVDGVPVINEVGELAAAGVGERRAVVPSGRTTACASSSAGTRVG